MEALLQQQPAAASHPRWRSRRASGVARAEPTAAGAAGPALNKYSSRITQPKSQGASQAMLFATGLKEEDMNKAQARASGTALLRVLRAARDRSSRRSTWASLPYAD